MGGSGGGHVSHGRSGGTGVVLGGQPGGPPGSDPCAALTFVTVLQSPRPTAVAVLAVGDRLEVRQDGGSPSLLAHTAGGQVVGAVVPPDIDTMADCLAAGRRFVATVLRVSGGAVEVRVQAG